LKIAWVAGTSIANLFFSRGLFINILLILLYEFQVVIVYIYKTTLNTFKLQNITS